LRGRGAALYAQAMTEIRDPEDCTTMIDVRAGVDALDRELVALLARRFGYMRAAARIKPDRTMVRDEARKSQVIVNVVAEAERLGAPAAIVGDLWEQLVEASIRYEGERFDTLHNAS
jgi:isochorismate pyruvate lyase